MSQTVSRESGDEYAVRWYEAGDRDGILSLYEREWGRRPSGDWFDWKYLRDPYLSHVPVTVAVRESGPWGADEVVGVQAYVPFRLRRGGDATLALQPADAVVDSDHRRNGLYTRMTEAAIARYETGRPSFFFNYPNPGAFRAQQDLGWVGVDRVATHYRLQDPAAVADGAERVPARLAAAAGPVLRGCLSLCERTGPAADLEVDEHDGVPAGVLADLYAAGADGFHAERDETFLDWWYANPAFDHTTYVARDGDGPAAAFVTRTRDGDRVRLFDALPLSGGRRGAFGRLLAAWCEDDADAAVLAVAESTLPPGLLARYGFVPDDAPVVARFCTGLRLAARPLGGDGGSPSQQRAALADPGNWALTFAEQDRF
ncbi:GNAT family N-acetyltransferase [Halostella litorea]|uniref:GNAT family N-acetyltransferase n=1 Tax=Halostella litorea TaxID=2528831 RepID=UPI0010923F15|nr:GNAT family N-acetyltransferase [Halostella litorea]